MKISILDLHAYASSPKDHYHPWLAEQAKLKGMEILTPNLPGDITPDFDEWLEISQKALDKLTGTITLTGRSLGCWTALKLAETNEIDTMVLVAPAFPIIFQEKDMRNKFMSWKVESVPALDAFFGNEVDLEKVNKNCKRIVFYLSDNDPYVKVDLVKPIINRYFPQAKIKVFPNADHFVGTAKDENRSFEVFPELLEEIVKQY